MRRPWGPYVATAAAFVAFAAVAPAIGSAPDTGRTEYMPCAQEDSLNCVWDAEHMGNGTGRSFFVGRDGHVTYLPHHIAHYLIYGS